jgi:hypothetical protein
MLQIPESVVAYSKQSEVRTAVGLLNAKKRPEVPEDLQWSEIETYYRAVLAMHQVQAEFAIVLANVWDVTWGSLDPSWEAGTPQDPGEGGKFDVAHVFSEECFTRVFRRSPYSVELCAAAFGNAGLQLGVGLWHGNKKVLKEHTLDSWEYDDEYGYCWTAESLIPIDRQISLDPLTNAVAQAKVLLSKL